MSIFLRLLLQKDGRRALERGESDKIATAEKKNEICSLDDEVVNFKLFRAKILPPLEEDT